MLRRFWILISALTLCLTLSFAEEAPAAPEPVLTDMGLDLGTASVHWPQVTGLEDSELQETVNRLIREKAGAAALTGRMALVMEADPPLTASWEGEIRGGILSCALYAEGPLESERFRSVWSSVNIDLTTGEAFTPADLFKEEDPDIGMSILGDVLTDLVAPDLSPHLSSGELLPIPEDFRIDAAGLTLYYPLRQLSTLSDRAGAVTLSWGEIGLPFDTDPDSVPVRFGLTQAQAPDADAFFAAFAEGQVPGGPAKRGVDVEARIRRYRVDGEPDLFEGGRYVQLEDSRFRRIWLMTDNLCSDIRRFDGSSVQGIRADRLSYAGVTAGAAGSAREDVLALLGEPYASVDLETDAAEAMRLAPGTSDYYRAGDLRLRLHYDEEGNLRSVFLLP